MTPEQHAKRLAKTAAWRKAHPERVKELCRRWGAANREKQNAYKRARYVQCEKAKKAAHYAANSTAKKASVAAYRKKNPDKIRALNAASYAENPELYLHHNRLRRARQQKATIGNPKAILAWCRAVKKKKRVVCYWCGSRVPTKGVHFDHILAIANGGPHELGNLCVSCQECNSRKKAKRIEDWNREVAQPVLF